MPGPRRGHVRRGGAGRFIVLEPAPPHARRVQGSRWGAAKLDGGAVIGARCTLCGADETRPDGRCAGCGATPGAAPPVSTAPTLGARVTPAPSQLEVLLPADPLPAEPSAATSARWWLRHGERWQLAIGVVAALLCAVSVGGYLTIVKINNARYPPDKPVVELFAALTAGDGPGAARLAGCTAQSCAAAVSADYQPPTDVQIKGVRYGGTGDRRTDTSIATVDVAYHLAGTGPQTAQVQVERSGSLFTRPFRIVSGVSGQFVLVSSNVERAHLGAVEVAVADEQRSPLRAGKPVQLLPGTYAVRPRDDDPLLIPTADRVPVDIAAREDGLAQPLPIQVGVQVRAEVVAAVDTQVEQLVTSCARQRVWKPRGCSFQIPGIVIGVQQVQWSVLHLPQVRVDVADDSVPGTKKALVRTVAPGRVQVTYTAFTSAGGDRRQFTHELPLRVRGEVTVGQPGTEPVISIT